MKVTKAKKEFVQTDMKSPKKNSFKKRLFYSLIATAAPVFVFLLSSAYSDTKKSEDKVQENKRAALSHDYGSQTIDNEQFAKNSNFKTSNIRKDLLPLNEVEEAEPVSEVAKPVTPEVKEDLNEGNIPPQDSLVTASNPAPANLDQLTTVLNVTDADIEALIKTFSKLTGRNYIVDSSVKGKITVHLPTPIKISEALKVFDSILLLKGFATVPVGDNIWKVIIAKDAKQTTIPSSNAKNITDESLVTEIIKSTHVSSEDLQKLVTQFISKDGYSQAISGTNLLILVDAGSNIARIKNLLKEIDIPPVDQDITIIPIAHATAEGIAEKINTILGQGTEKADAAAANAANPFSLPFRAGLRRNLNNAGANPESPAEDASGARASQTKIIPDERTNSLIVVADEFTTLKIRALAEQLDSEVDKSSGRFWVYRLEHADAAELSEVLSNLISGSGGSPSSGEKSGSSISRSNNRSGSQSSGLGGAQAGLGGAGGAAGGSSRNRGGISRNNNNSGVPGLITDSSKVAFEDEISVAADPSTNSLIVNANKADFEKLSQVIGELDVKRRQVLVEATILEVSLNDQEALGVEFQGTGATTEAGIISQTNFGGLTNLLTNPAGLSDLTIAAASAGTLTLPGGLQIPSQAALLSAISRHSNVNVLSAPTILSTDNQEAEIIVGENVPFVSSTSTNQTNLNNTFNQIQRQDVGITLKITPQLGTGDFLTLQIFVEISNVVDGTRNDSNGPTTTVRTTDTVVAVKNRQMIITGGLIQDSVNGSTRGIPFLEDVPVLGHLFKREEELKRRTNLLIFLTPQIIQDQYDARDQTKTRIKPVADLMKKYESEPSREEILKSPAIDEVFEPSKEERIKGNVPLTENSKATVPVKRTKPSTVAKSNANGEYEFNVLNEDSQNQTAGLDKIFVVFQSVNGKVPAGLNGNSKGSVGLIMPKSSGKIFSAGNQYQKANTDLICLGIYSDAKEAETMHADLLNWNDTDLTSQSELEADGWSFSQ